MSPFVKRALENKLPVSDLTGVTTPDLIRMLRGEPECQPGCSCRGAYEGDDRRAHPRHALVD